MDNLTHSLVGLFLARAGFKRFTPRGTAIMMVAANAPDFDVIFTLGGSTSYIHWHRNITHSLIAIPFMALLSVAIVRWAGRKKVRWLAAFSIAVVAVASHLILDLTNVYGVRLLLPFSGHWFHWDLTPVIDLTIWVILLIGVVAPWFGRLVGSEIGERKREAGGGWAIIALLLLGAYDYGRGVLHDRAVTVMGSRKYNGQTPLRVGAFPLGNPLMWDGIAELNNAYVGELIDMRERTRLRAVETYYKAEESPAILAAMKTEPFRRFLEFVQYPIWVTEPAPEPENATRVRLVDLRFGTPALPGFQAVATVSDRGQVIDSRFTMGGTRPR